MSRQTAGIRVRDRFLASPRLPARFTPSAAPTKTQRPWPAVSGFDNLGWAPDGDVWGTYAVVPNTTYMGCFIIGTASENVLPAAVIAYSDADGDGNFACYTEDTEDWYGRTEPEWLSGPTTY